VVSLDFSQTRHVKVGIYRRLVRFQLGRRGSQYGLRGKDHGALNEVLQFPNIPWPGISGQCFHGFLRDFLDSLGHTPSVELREMPDQLRNVFSSMP